MELFFIILAVLGLLTLYAKHLKEKDEQKRQDLIEQAKQRKEERMAKLVRDYEAKQRSIERGEDFYTTSDGSIRVKRTYLDANFMRGAIMGEDIFFAKDEYDGYVTLTKEQFDDLHTRKQEYEQRQEMLKKTTELNNQGIEYEKSGNDDAAITAYEECVRIGYDATHSYDRILVLYRKCKDYENEKRICLLAIDKFKLKKHKDRLVKIEELLNKK